MAGCAVCTSAAPSRWRTGGCAGCRRGSSWDVRRPLPLRVRIVQPMPRRGPVCVRPWCINPPSRKPRAVGRLSTTAPPPRPSWSPVPLTLQQRSICENLLLVQWGWGDLREAPQSDRNPPKGLRQETPEGGTAPCPLPTGICVTPTVRRLPICGGSHGLLCHNSRW